jgi:SAM-dependent methyltransferase
MAVDHYAKAAPGFAHGAELVYAPIAAELVALGPYPLAGRTVLDAGAGTGAASRALRAHGARQLAMDMSLPMLAANAAERPPCFAADITALPLADDSVDAAVAAFVVNHLTDPAAGFAELRRVTRSGGAILASAFSNSNQDPARDQVDAVAAEAGWRPPPWYSTLKATAAPLVGTPRGMAGAAGAAGLAVISAEERSVDVGVTAPDQLVAYRLGHPTFADWLDTIGPEEAAQLARRAVEAIRSTMRPYRPSVVFLVAGVR